MEHDEISHSIECGALVELENGERLFITDLTHDCNGTPLYNLGIHGHDIIYRGFPVECLTVVELNNPPVAAIEYALHDNDTHLFLQYWNEGSFVFLRENWKNIPDAVFIGADSQFKPKSKPRFDHTKLYECKTQGYHAHDGSTGYMNLLNDEGDELL